MIHGRTCNLCEAMCGILVEVEGGDVVSIKGDPDDVLSRGHICPKATALADLHTDVDRLKTPLRKRGNDFEECSWEQAYDGLAGRVQDIQRRHGRDAVAVYQGNPTVHSVGAITMGQLFVRALGTKSRYSATSLDQLPHMLAGLEMFGNQLLIPIPDLDRTRLFVVVGGNPLASNGSIMGAPGMKQRLRSLQERGGRVVVVDPRRTETAAVADQHLFIQPGTDAALLAALAKTILDDKRASPARLAAFVDGTGALRAALAPFTIERASAFTGIAVDDIKGLASALVEAGPAIVYGRVGACTQEFGGTTGWLVNVLNILTGNLDREGGVMFTRPAADIVALSQGKLGRALGLQGHFARRKSRVRGLPEFGGEFPTACLAEEIETPGRGQIRALITAAGNPVLSAPDGSRLERALPSLEFMASIDMYVNETTKHADLILPPTSPLEREHYDVLLHVLSVRNTARWSKPVFERSASTRHDWEIFLALASRFGRKGLSSRIESRLLRGVLDGRGPRVLVDLLLRLGPYRTSVSKLERSPHGIDFGPLKPSLPERLQTADKRIQVAPAIYLEDLQRLQKKMAASSSSSSSLVLIGRRDLRSNNSWLHNSERLVRGKPRCTVLMHPQDASDRGLLNGQEVDVTSSTGKIRLPLDITDGIKRGVVSVPHGWGHGRAGVRLSVASARPGVSINDITDATRIDELTGNAAFSGVPVDVVAVSDSQPG
ncbi:MAG: molybdopterin-dependent oxidoreductase [Deltaproteobacteria bacterium]|nr:molybdopterin-dependent oxidoreductase [Deltaproteobacteria bacterium]